MGTSRLLWFWRPRFLHSQLFLLGLYSSRLSGSCRIGLRLFRPGRLPGGGHFRLLEPFRDQLRRGIWIWGGVVVAFTRSLGRLYSTPRPGPSARQMAWHAELPERQGGLKWLSFGQARAPALRQPPSFFPLNTAPVVRPCFFPATTALRLFPRGRASTEDLGAPTREAPRRVSAITLCVSEAQAALTLQWAFWSHIRLNRHSKAADFGELSHFRHLRPSRHRYDEVGVGGRPLAGSWS